MMGLGTNELLIIMLIILVLFGGKKIPEMMKGMGEGIKALKQGAEYDPDATKVNT
jgi:sec-independent protein translocase protein TatA